jgi:hypothetical protein
MRKEYAVIIQFLLHLCLNLQVARRLKWFMSQILINFLMEPGKGSSISRHGQEAEAATRSIRPSLPSLLLPFGAGLQPSEKFRARTLGLLELLVLARTIFRVRHALSATEL